MAIQWVQKYRVKIEISIIDKSVLEVSKIIQTSLMMFALVTRQIISPMKPNWKAMKYKAILHFVDIVLDFRTLMASTVKWLSTINVKVKLVMVKSNPNLRRNPKTIHSTRKTTTRVHSEIKITDVFIFVLIWFWRLTFWRIFLSKIFSVCFWIFFTDHGS